jgi:nitrogen regulatory protein P-II 1
MATKKIEAIIRPEKYDDVKKALTDIGIVGMSVYDIKGRGRGAGMVVYGRTGSYTIDTLPRKCLAIILSEENLETTISAIKSAAYTGEKGDGMIFVYPVDDVVRISTNERGKSAIMYQGDIDSKKKK